MVTSYRALFISDIHLGSRHFQAERLLRFLESHKAQTIYLVGDILDGLEINWPPSHYRVLDLLHAEARAGGSLIYIPGNHDAFMREMAGFCMGPFMIAMNAIHVTADSRRFLVLHGDEFDVGILRLPRCMARLFELASDIARPINTKLMRFFVGLFERRLVKQAKRGGFDGVIAGHSHLPRAEIIDDLEYYNCGDWFHSYTAVVEHHNGRLELIDDHVRSARVQRGVAAPGLY